MAEAAARGFEETPPPPGEESEATVRTQLRAARDLLACPVCGEYTTERPPLTCANGHAHCRGKIF